MLALIAGTGALPNEVVADLAETPVICAMEGFIPDDLSVDFVFPLEHLGSFISDLKDQGVTEICMAGAVQRPTVDPSRIDAATMPLVPVLQQAIMTSDDGALRAVIGIFENAGWMSDRCATLASGSGRCGSRRKCSKRHGISRCRPSLCGVKRASVSG